jgi:hypothetical protein
VCPTHYACRKTPELNYVAGREKELEWMPASIWFFLPCLYMLNWFCCSLLTLLGDGVNRVDESRDITEEDEQETEPELNLVAKLDEDAKRGEDDGDEDVDAIRGALRRRHRVCSWVLLIPSPQRIDDEWKPSKH